MRRCSALTLALALALVFNLLLPQLAAAELRKNIQLQLNTVDSKIRGALRTGAVKVLGKEGVGRFVQKTNISWVDVKKARDLAGAVVYNPSLFKRGEATRKPEVVTRLRRDSRQNTVVHQQSRVRIEVAYQDLKEALLTGGKLDLRKWSLYLSGRLAGVVMEKDGVASRDRLGQRWGQNKLGVNRESMTLFAQFLGIPIPGSMLQMEKTSVIEEGRAADGRQRIRISWTVDDSAPIKATGHHKTVLKDNGYIDLVQLPDGKVELNATSDHTVSTRATTLLAKLGRPGQRAADRLSETSLKLFWKRGTKRFGQLLEGRYPIPKIAEGELVKDSSK